MIKKTNFKTKDYCKVKFSFAAENAITIDVLGINNNWETPISLKKKKDSSFNVELKLPTNTTHQFKYLVNNSIWYNEPDADSQLMNEFGSSNSVITL